MTNWALFLYPNNDQGGPSSLTYLWRTYTGTNDGFPTGLSDEFSHCENSKGERVPVLTQGDSLMVVFSYHMYTPENGANGIPPMNTQDVVPPGGIAVSQVSPSVGRGKANPDFPTSGGRGNLGFCCVWGPEPQNQCAAESDPFHFSVNVTCTQSDGEEEIVFSVDPEMVVKTKEGEELPG